MEFGLLIGFTEHSQNVTTNNCIHALYNSLQLSLSLLSLLNLHRLSRGNGFQRRSLLSFRIQVLTGQRLSPNSLPGWRPSHTNLLFSLPSQDSPLMAADPRYIASARIAERTPLPTVLLLRTSVASITWERPLFTEPLPSNGCFIAAYDVVVT
jgi:hypothetical protein